MLLVIVVGIFYVQADNYSPFVPPSEPAEAASGWTAPLIQSLFGIPPATFGIGGILTGAAIVFFAFIGFDVVATAAEETKDPKRDMPRGILGSLAICTTLYVAVSLVVVGMQHYTELSTEAPLADAFRSVGLPFLSGAISVGALAGLTSVVLILLLGQSRVLFAMSRDRLLPPGLATVHPRYGTPYRITLITAGVVAVLAGVRAAGHARRAGEHRDAVRLRPRLHRRVGPPPHAAGAAPLVPRPGHQRAAVGLRAGLRLPDAQPAGRHLGPVRRLDGDRSGRLPRPTDGGAAGSAFPVAGRTSPSR